jgi:protein gp37
MQETDSPQLIDVSRLHPHPDNPRLSPRDEIVEQIAAGLATGFDPAHALIVRPFGDDWQILAGHHRVLAATKVTLQTVPCWVRDLDDDAAYMLLVTSNAQSELSAIERGIHALNGTKKGKHELSIAAYAAKIGRPDQRVNEEVNAAEVYLAAVEAHAAAFDGPPEAQIEFLELLHEQSSRRCGNFTAIHRAPKRMWPRLVKTMIDEDWTVEETRSQVAVITQSLGPRRPLSPVTDRAHDHVSIEEWRKLGPPARRALLQPDLGGRAAPSFNRQTGPDIEWAMWSSNPVTGCEHTCSYCYAREIANRPTMTEVYPFGFMPTLHPRRLLSPQHMTVPDEAETDTRYRNVFLGSMADMFGRWVPVEWIDAVVAMIGAAPDWNFLCLTKFPKRMAEFEIPPNAWMGTTVDLQARVNAAEDAFANVQSGVRWLSCEPLIEPLRFKHLDRFNWIVIGGASSTDNTPTWRPPFEWVADVVRQARDAGLKVYMKTNLGIANRILELPFDAPIVADPVEAPAVFHYLGRNDG